MKARITRLLRAVAACALLAGALPAFAVDDADTLFGAKTCFACHSVTRGEFKRLGPYIVDVAAKYRSQKDGADYLVRKILQGSSGVWGDPKVSVMPPNHVSEEEARVLATWILSKQ